METNEMPPVFGSLSELIGFSKERMPIFVQIESENMSVGYLHAPKQKNDNRFWYSLAGNGPKGPGLYLRATSVDWIEAIYDEQFQLLYKRDSPFNNMGSIVINWNDYE